MYATNSNEASIRAVLQIIHNSVSNASYSRYFLCCLFTNINRHTKMKDVGSHHGSLTSAEHTS